MARKIQHSLYCDETLWEQVRVVAGLEDRSMTWVLEKAIKEYLSKKMTEHSSRKDTENG